MRVVQLERGARRLGRGQRIDDDDAARALDDRHVGNVEAAHLVHAGRHLEQPVVHVQPRHAPQARVDRRRRVLAIQKAVGRQVPQRRAAR